MWCFSVETHVPRICGWMCCPALDFCTFLHGIGCRGSGMPCNAAWLRHGHVSCTPCFRKAVGVGVATQQKGTPRQVPLACTTRSTRDLKGEAQSTYSPAQTTAAVRQLLEAAEGALQAGCQAVRPGLPVTVVGDAIADYLFPKVRSPECVAKW